VLGEDIFKQLKRPSVTHRAAGKRGRISDATFIPACR
jgi:hypothetical protein